MNPLLTIHGDRFTETVTDLVHDGPSSPVLA